MAMKRQYKNSCWTVYCFEKSSLNLMMITSIAPVNIVLSNRSGFFHAGFLFHPIKNYPKLQIQDLNFLAHH